MVDGPALSAIGIGSLFVYAGIRGKSILQTIQSVVQGTAPATTAQTNPIKTDTGISAGLDAGSSGVSGGVAVGGGSPQKILQQTAAQFGWGSGAEWQALQSLEMGEAEFNPKNRNKSSNAYGLAQSLGHPFPGGPAANGIDEYGGQGLTPAQSRAASMGDPTPQALWMCRYIKAVYGTPRNAYSEWLSRHPHWY